MPNRPQGRHCINVSAGKTSYLLLKKKGPPFPDLYDPANPAPQLGSLITATVNDDDNGFYFNPTIVAQTDKKRLALKIVSGLGGGGADPLDGLLTITLFIVTGVVLGTPTTSPYTPPVVDAPVDYISDPAGP
jgi:hypothetical protein